MNKKLLFIFLLNVIFPILSMQQAGQNQNVYGDTPLILATRAGNVSLVQQLLSQGTNALAPNKFGRTPLWYAQCNGKQELVDILQAKEPQLYVRLLPQELIVYLTYFVFQKNDGDRKIKYFFQELSARCFDPKNPCNTQVVNCRDYDQIWHSGCSNIRAGFSSLESKATYIIGKDRGWYGNVYIFDEEIGDLICWFKNRSCYALDQDFVYVPEDHTIQKSFGEPRYIEKYHLAHDQKIDAPENNEQVYPISGGIIKQMIPCPSCNMLYILSNGSWTKIDQKKKHSKHYYVEDFSPVGCASSEKYTVLLSQQNYNKTYSLLIHKDNLDFKIFDQELNFSPNISKNLYIVNDYFFIGDNRRLKCYSLNTTDVELKWNLKGFFRNIVTSPQSRNIFIEMDTQVLALAKDSMNKKKPLWQNAQGLKEIVLSPDGTKLYAKKGNEICVLDANTGNLVQTITPARQGSILGVTQQGNVLLGY